MQILNIKLSIKNGGCYVGNSMGAHINTYFVPKNFLSQSPIKIKKVKLNALLKKQYFDLISQNNQINFLNRNIPKFDLQNYRVKTLRSTMQKKNKYNQRLKINLILLDYIYSLNCNDLFGYIGRVEKNNPLKNNPLINNSLVQYLYIPEVFLASEFAAMEITKAEVLQKAVKDNQQFVAMKIWENRAKLSAAGKLPLTYKCEYDWSWSDQPITITPLKSVLDNPLTEKKIKFNVQSWKRNQKALKALRENNYSYEYDLYLDRGREGKLTTGDLYTLQTIKEERLIREQKEKDQAAEAYRLALLNNEFWLD
jgi:hypothetical protein